MNALIKLITGASFVCLAGCAGIEGKSHPAYAPMDPIVYTNPKEGVTEGSLYSERRGLSLFADTRARSVGDIINVVLIESTQASKNAGTAVDRGASIDVAPPTLFGRTGTNFGAGDYSNLTLSNLSPPIPNLRATDLVISPTLLRAQSLFRLPECCPTVI